MATVDDSITILQPDVGLIDSFHAALDSVARERVHLEMIEAPPLEKVIEFQSKIIGEGEPVAYALANGKVVGWCDILPKTNPRCKHRGGLGMGVLKEFRRRGIGMRLLTEVSAQAKARGLEKIELDVFTINIAAIALYKRAGFEREGLIKNYRKLDGQYFDCLAMGKFI